MSELIMMYVYFDELGDIKCISPAINPIFIGYKYSTLPLSDVEPFLSAKKNPIDYCMKPVKRVTDVTYKLTRKPVLAVNQLRILDGFLTEVETYARSVEANILIEIFPKDKILKISINPDIKSLHEDGTDEEIEKINTLINTTSSSLFFTRKRDPYYLLETVNFSPRELFSHGIIHVSYTGDLENTSIYTKKIIDGYGCAIR